MGTFPEDLKYTKEHEWIKLNDEGIATVGITEFAQGELGDIVYVEVETQGQTIAKDELFGTIEAVKTVSDLYMPVSGEVLEFNETLEDEPELVNSSPYEDGWMIKIKLSKPDEVNELMSQSEYVDLIGQA